ncbi:MAG: transcription-repair coupling factor [Leptospirillum sp.]
MKTLFPSLSHRIKQLLPPTLTHGDEISLTGIPPEASFLLPGLILEQIPNRTLWILTANMERARSLYNDINSFNALFREAPDGLLLPEEEILPYEEESPPDLLRAERISVLSELSRRPVPFVVSTFPAIARKTLPKRLLSGGLSEITLGSLVDRQELIKSLVALGFFRVPQVTAPGEFSVRGAILDLYTPSRPEPVRLEFTDDELTSMKGFDPNTQRSMGSIEKLDLAPSHEWLPPIDRSHFSEELKDFLSVHQATPLAPGIERYIGQFYDDITSPLDYTPDPVLFIEDPHALEIRINDWKERICEAYESIPLEDRALLPSPEKAFIPFEAKGKTPFSFGSDHSRILLSVFRDDPDATDLFSPPEKLIDRNESWILRLRELSSRMRVITFFGSRGQRDRFQEILENQTIPFTPLSDLQEDTSPSVGTIQTILGDIGEGIYIAPDNTLLVSDTFLFRKKYDRTRETRFRTAAAAFRRDQIRLAEGEPVVHLQQGIGIYRGLREIEVGNIPGEFLIVEYRDGDKLYVPVDQVDLLKPWRGPEGSPPKLDRLGGHSWQKTRSRVRKEIEKISQELVDLYAKRKALPGFPFSQDSIMISEFENAFPHDLTPDQEEAIRDIREDMESPAPMDRLVLGEVGFGKTEVAMRAAFKAVADGKQVAVLVPTTLLCLQHFETFKERFSGFPVRVEQISRILTAKEQKLLRQDLSEGKVDIIIGTSALLGAQNIFRDLGLLIIDEEQRFGVGHKEKLKNKYPTVDVLTLSATPIPRTLQMSLSGLRGISFIMTPPPGRKPIKTAILPFDRHRIREAIDRELARDGQVFFIHNRVSSISRMAHYISSLFPGVPVGVAHGQMDSQLMETIMDRFISGHYRILVSTAIVESGLDIPQANTIIINRSDLFGIAELYQLRGRVGRSGTQAYCYFLVAGEGGLTELAKKRLKTLQDNTELGSGYQIAMRDLEIRGAGSLLGHQQTGHISMVGLDLYMEMVEEAIQTRVEPVAIPVVRETPRIDLGREARLPEDYVVHPGLRIDFYRRLAHSFKDLEIEQIESELRDRFGPLPRPARALILGAKIRVMTTRMGISEVRLKDREIFLKPSAEKPLSPRNAGKIAQAFPDRITFHRDGSFTLSGPASGFPDDLARLEELLA